MENLPVVKGDDGEVFSFKRPKVKGREIPCWLGVEARPRRVFLGQDLSVLEKAVRQARLKMWERRGGLGESEEVSFGEGKKV